MNGQTEIKWEEENGVAKTNDWNEVKLSDIIELIGGGTPKTSVAEYWDGDIPWLSVADFNTGRKFVYEAEKNITKAGFDNCSTNLLRKGDIIISARGTVGVVAVLGRSMTFNQSCYGIRGLEGISYNEYIFYLLKYSVLEFLQIAHGGVFDTITRDTFKEMGVMLPALVEQRAIASVLSSLDDKIDLLHRQNATLEALTKTLFRQWFVAFDFPNSEGQCYRSNGGTMVDSDLDEIPENWRTGSFIELASNFDSKRIPLSKMQREQRKGPYPYYGAASVVDFVDGYLFDGDYLLVGEDGTVITSEGYPIVQRAWGKFWVNNHTHVLQAKAPFTNDYLFSQLNEMNVASIISGAVQPKITQGSLNAFKVVIPPATIVESFVMLVQPWFDRVRFNINQIQALANLRDTLLPKLMSGEIRVDFRDGKA